MLVTLELLQLRQCLASCKSTKLQRILPIRQRRTIPRPYSSLATEYSLQDPPEPEPIPESHLNPSPSSYATTPFIDRCTIAISSGAGGSGCVSFLREKFVPDGPPNGGDGGTGGNIYIQAVRSESSLHKVSRRPILKAARGQNGKGKSMNGPRGDDILISVPVGTVVREISRFDPVAEERLAVMEQRLRRSAKEEDEEETEEARREKFIRYNGILSGKDIRAGESGPPKIPRIHRTALITPPGPITLDMDTPSTKPYLLLAGALGGLGNPHFVTKDIHRPKYATKGEAGAQMTLQLELKVLADVGLVGLPNAGKSTLLRALTNSRTRVGDWEFTTLQPSIGVVVLDDNKGRPALPAFMPGLNEDGEVEERRTHFTIADIPGIIEDAHMDKGLGIGFLRHIERAMCLCFVVDLSRKDQTAVDGLKALWRGVSEYETMRSREVSSETERRIGSSPQVDDSYSMMPRDHDPVRARAPMTSKPWFVVATKADLPGTQDNFQSLKAYIDALNKGTVEHPSGRKNAWKKHVKTIPISAIKAEGVQAIPKTIVDLLE